MYECISVPSTEKHDKCSANSTTGVYKFCPDIITQSSCDICLHTCSATLVLIVQQHSCLKFPVFIACFSQKPSTADIYLSFSYLLYLYQNNNAIYSTD